MRPAGWPPMDMSKKTCGIATVFFKRRRFFERRAAAFFRAAALLHLCGRVLAEVPAAANRQLWLVAWVQRAAARRARRASARRGLLAFLIFGARCKKTGYAA